MSDKQVSYAKDIADELWANGHDVSTLDILDALASCGLSLSMNFGNPAALAYASEVESIAKEEG
jgi:hypothetical protein